MAWPHIFANLSGNVQASYLDDNFNAACLQTDFLALQSAVTALPGSSTPLIPVAGGNSGAAATFARSDHAHPPQQATLNLQTGTTYTLAATDDGKVVSLSNAASITLTLPNSLPAGFSCLVEQYAAGVVAFSAAAGGTLRQRQSFAHTAGQYAVASLYVRANSGGAAAEWVLAGDLVT